MKAKIMLGLVVVLLGMAFAAAPQFGGEPIPPCVPGQHCTSGKLLEVEEHFTNLTV
ncbi:MAG TPA: hypothetical protein VFP71_12340 [Candidatus Angelobacter sp.]|nr:hypothetical protein [Candidatus Angelobacter sp.]